MARPEQELVRVATAGAADGRRLLPTRFRRPEQRRRRPRTNNTGLAGRHRRCATRTAGRLMTARMDGRRLLVVGGGSQPCDDADAPPGNGRAISVAAAREGAAVAVAD